MFDPTNPNAILSFEDKDFGRMPKSEDGLHEYKSSLVKDDALAEKIGKAASGFWNSGGGLFVAGVNEKTGVPDGGISLTVGRQSRRDWIDRAVHKVTPPAPYIVHLVENSGSCPDIRPGHAVAFIAFASSEIGPHQGPDLKYYVRAGAHTEPASHFLIESIRARRAVSKPRLVCLTRLEPYTTEDYWMTVELVTVTSAPVLEAFADLNPRPPHDGSPRFPLYTPLIDMAHPFSFRFSIPTDSYSGQILVRFKDLTGNELHYEEMVSGTTCLPQEHRGSDLLSPIAACLDRLNTTLQRIAR